MLLQFKITAAYDSSRFQTAAFQDFLHFRQGLLGQFPGRTQHQGLHKFLADIQLFSQRYQKGQRLAGTGLSPGHNILACQESRDSLFLYRHRFRNSHLLQPFNHGRAYFHLGKCIRHLFTSFQLPDQI